MNNLKRPVLAFGMILSLLVTFCPSAIAATTERERTTTTTVVTPTTTVVAPAHERTETKEVVKETVEKPRSSGPAGVVGKTVALVGDVVAFPFKVVGYMIGAIF